MKFLNLAIISAVMAWQEANGKAFDASQSRRSDLQKFARKTLQDHHMKVMGRRLEDADYNFDYDYEDGEVEADADEGYNNSYNFNNYNYNGNNKNGAGCQFDFQTFSYTCNVCIKADSNQKYCLTQTCTVTDEDMQAMECNICSTVYKQDGQSDDVEFCYSADCDMSTLFTDTMEEACECTGATVNGESCSYCGFCKTDDHYYDLTSTSTTNVASGMDLVCPVVSGDDAATEMMKTSCPINQRLATFGKIALAFALAAVAVGMIAGAWYYRGQLQKKKELEEEDPTDYKEHTGAVA